VRWNGSDRATVYVSSEELHVSVADADLARTGSAQVSVADPATGAHSEPLAFIIYDTPQTAGVADLSGARVFPNPWSSDLTPGSPIHFTGLTPTSTIKIFTLSARWVQTLRAGASGVLDWDRRNDNGDLVASGYYLYVITDDQGNKRRGKIAIVR
jgi:hypothetical protein